MTFSNHLVLERPSIRIAAPIQSPATLRILHLCDLHLRGRAALVSRLIPIITRLDYDLALLGGDFADTTAGRRHAVDLMRHINAPLGCFGVPGNHDRFRYTFPNTWRARIMTSSGKPTREGIHIPLNSFREQMSEAGVRLLRNENARIKLPQGDLWLLGLDDAASWFDDLETTLREVPPDAAKIMFTHSPDAFPRAATAGVPLVIAGHTHGGQIVLPKIGATIKRTRLPLNPPSGLFQIGDSQLYINRGAGGTIPLRINCPPEITLIELHIEPSTT